jgi:hypothetical protein
MHMHVHMHVCMHMHICMCMCMHMCMRNVWSSEMLQSRQLQSCSGKSGISNRLHHRGQERGR